MKIKFSLLLILIFVIGCTTGCKKGSSDTSILRSGLALKANPNAQQYVVAVPSIGDTLVMQDVDGNSPTVTTVQKRMGSCWFSGFKYTLVKRVGSVNRTIGLLFYRKDPYDPNHAPAMDCAMLTDIFSHSVYDIGEVSHFSYGCEVFYNDGYHDSNSESIYAFHTNYDSLQVVSRVPLTNINGCNTNRVSGTVHCAVSTPTLTCGTYAIDMNFCLNAQLQ